MLRRKWTLSELFPHPAQMSYAMAKLKLFPGRFSRAKSPTLITNRFTPVMKLSRVIFASLRQVIPSPPIYDYLRS